MAACPRSDIVREGEIGTYHTWSRCVQEAFLCGWHPFTGQSFEHRREWIRQLLEYLASVFAVDVGSYNILSNHQHLIARTRPDIAATWSDEQVAWRWKLAWPQWRDGQWIREPTDQEVEEVLAEKQQLPVLRGRLSSLSWFMARWKEPIAKLANAESGTKGHFYEQRFGSRELLDDSANLCCHIYVDLNQVKAGQAATLVESNYSAIQDRLLAWRAAEVRESVEKFNRRTPAGYVLQTEDMERLLADCFLAPIGNTGPVLLEPPVVLSATRETADTADVALMPAAELLPAAVETVEKAGDDGVAASLDSSANAVGPDTSGEAAAVSRQTSVADETRTSPNHDVALPAGTSTAEAAPGNSNSARATRTAPSRRPGRRPPPTRERHRRLQRTRRRRASDHPFLGIPRTQYLALVEWSCRQLTTPDPEPPADIQTVLRSQGLEPKQWCTSLEHFEALFPRMVGHIDRIAEVLQRLGTTRAAAQSACAALFTRGP